MDYLQAFFQRRYYYSWDLLLVLGGLNVFMVDGEIRRNISLLSFSMTSAKSLDYAN
jgi:hypothetical protein